MVKAYITKVYGSRFLIEFLDIEFTNALQKQVIEGNSEIDVSIRTLG